MSNDLSNPIKILPILKSKWNAFRTLRARNKFFLFFRIKTGINYRTYQPNGILLAFMVLCFSLEIFETV